MTTPSPDATDTYKTRMSALMFAPVLAVANAPMAISLELNPIQWLQDAIDWAINATIGVIEAGVTPFIEGLMPMLTASYTWMPVPGAEPLETPVTQPWPGIMELAETFKTISLVLLVIGLIAYLASSALGHGFGQRGKGFVKRSVLVFPLLFFMDLWAWMLIFVMKIVSAGTELIMPAQSEVTNAVATMLTPLLSAAGLAAGPTGGASLWIAGGLILVGLMGFVAFLFIGIVRIVGLTFMIALFPLSLVLWTYGGIGYLEDIGEIGSKGMQWFLAFAFFPLPAAASIALGTQLLQAEALMGLGGGTGAGAIATLGGAIVQLFVGLTAFAFGPWIAIKMTKPGSAAIRSVTQAAQVAAGAYVGGPSGAAKAGSKSFSKYASVKDNAGEGVIGPGEAASDRIGQAQSRAVSAYENRAPWVETGPQYESMSDVEGDSALNAHRHSATYEQATISEATDPFRNSSSPSVREPSEETQKQIGWFHSRDGEATQSDLSEFGTQPALEDGDRPVAATGEETTPTVQSDGNERWGDTGRATNEDVIDLSDDEYEVIETTPVHETSHRDVQHEAATNSTQRPLPNYASVEQAVHGSKRHNTDDIVDETPNTTTTSGGSDVERDLNFDGVDIPGHEPDE